MDRRKLAVLLMSGGAPSLTHLFRDEFSTAQAAPLGATRTCEPGPGTWDIVDTTNTLSITGGELVSGLGVATYNPQFNAPVGLTGTAIDGTTVCWKVKKEQALNNGAFVLYYQKAIGQAFIAQAGSGVQCASLPNTGDAAGSTYHQYYYVWNETMKRLIGIMDGKLLATALIGTHKDCEPNIASYTSQGRYTCDYVRVANLGAPWNTATAVLTSRNTNPAADATLTSEADAMIEYQWEWEHGNQVHNCYIRRTDDDNSLIVRIDKAGDTIKLIQREAGSETELASAALTTGGYYPFIQILMEGQTVRVWSRQVQKINYTTASFNQTATGVKVSGFTTGDMATRGIYCWPRTLSAAALAELQRLG